jgi:hypothetical protein
VIGANMQCKLFVALELEVPHHSSKELPVGAPEGLKTQAHAEQP